MNASIGKDESLSLKAEFKDKSSNDQSKLEHIPFEVTIFLINDFLYLLSSYIYYLVADAFEIISD
jgi:hypothetical protein